MQETAKLICAMEAGDTLDHLLASAPRGKGKSKRFQAVDRSLCQHAKAEEANTPISRLGRCQRLPNAPSLLLPISQHLAMQRQHPEDDIFLHHAYDAILDHAHELHVAGYGFRLELIDPGADGKEHFQITKARDIVWHVPGQQVPYLFRIDSFAAMVKFQVRELARKSLPEDCPLAASELKRNAIDARLRLARHVDDVGKSD